ncbi:helix-hairpin-helix domain-containing protein [Flavobacterium sp.]|uniref:ComEA family DNA-binding protein n=1 Tax=Flavobacterium sp. TaxID=239 RepID=UPI00260AF4C3|nr:helix-hairpin-helix domain-containing protein [Flavobacterium sp.]
MKSIFLIPKLHRRGLGALFLLLILLQLCLYFYSPTPSIPVQDNKELALLETAYEKKLAARKFKKFELKPFNPNFISDYKAYQLKIPTAAFERLQAYRKKGLYVNSATDFQKVTGVSNELLQKLSPLFAFPSWTNKKTQTAFQQKRYAVKAIDLNTATEAQLVEIPGIGVRRAQQILDQRKKLGGFCTVNQLKLLYGVDELMFDQLKSYLKIGAKPKLNKLNINRASVKELSAFPYFNYGLAREIVKIRSRKGTLIIEDLANVEGFTQEKLTIIVLYLEF